MSLLTKHTLKIQQEFRREGNELQWWSHHSNQIYWQTRWLCWPEVGQELDMRLLFNWVNMEPWLPSWVGANTFLILLLLLFTSWESLYFRFLSFLCLSHSKYLLWSWLTGLFCLLSAVVIYPSVCLCNICNLFGCRQLMISSASL